MYCQLELETVGGKVFTGPFVFELSDGIKKLSGIGWLTKTAPGKGRGELRLVKVLTFPKEALWHPQFDDEAGGKHDRRVRQVEAAWERLAFLTEEEERKGGKNG